MIEVNPLLVALAAILVAAFALVMHLVQEAKQAKHGKRSSHLPAPYIRVTTAKLIDEIVEPGKKLRFEDGGVEMWVRVQRIEGLEYDPVVGKTRLLLSRHNAPGYEAYYVHEDLEKVHEALVKAMAGEPQ